MSAYFCDVPIVPRKIRQVLKDYKKAGFHIVPGAGKGDHKKLKHIRFGGSIIVDGKAGSDAKPYQEKQLKEALKNIK